MFGLNKYVTKLHNIKWKFNPDLQKDYEDLLFVTFEEKQGYFFIQSILYTYVDILQGMEELNFVISKVENEITLEIVES